MVLRHAIFILQEWLKKRPLQAGEYALAAAFGPGFSAELLLLQASKSSCPKLPNDRPATST
jgi:predicted naringenin-chalcone synthase